MNSQTSLDASGLAGHPKGLTTLFFTELWERFSYYGMRAILVLYMVAPVANGGLAFDTKTAASMLCVRMGERQPSSPAKFTLGLLFIGLGYLLMIPAAMLTASGKISPLWLVGLLIAAGILAVLTPAIRRLMGNVH